MRTTVALVGAVAVLAAGVALGAVGEGRTGPGAPGSGGAPVALPEDLELAGALSSFAGCDDYLAHVQEHALEQVTPYGLGRDGPGTLLDQGSAVDDGGFADESSAGAEPLGRHGAAPSPATAPDHVSGTNVQEHGVDEPDRVETDGDTLYAVAGQRLRIIDISGDEPRDLAEVELHESAWDSELLLTDDRLLVTSRRGGYIPFAREGSAEGRLVSTATTTLTAIDVADPSEPEVVERLILDGATLSARMVDGVARVVVRTEPGTNLRWQQPEAGHLRPERESLAANEELIRTSDADDWLPYYVHETADGDRNEGTVLPCERIAAPEEFSGLGHLSVLTIDVAAGSLEPDAGAVAVLAGGDTVYASTDRLYVATQRWPGDAWRGGGGGVWTAAEPADDIEVERRFPDEEAEREPDVTTQLHAFAIDDPSTTEYLASGAVDGTLLSQWALSEHDGVLRVASTVGDPWSPASSASSVTTLGLEDGGLVELGRVDGLGPTETIHAVRFLGDVGYVVTFRRTDPLYTVDLADPTAPAVVGELEIPGFSAYLHPVGDGQLIGVGQDADEEGRIEGAQVSLFDVSDPADPQRTDTVTVPNSQSPVQHDHRAFLHWPSTGLTVVPVTGSRSGALALVPDGDTLRAAADHAPDELVLHHADVPDPDAGEEEGARASDGTHASGILRSLVTGDRLVTVSERGVIVHDLATLEDRGTLGF